MSRSFEGLDESMEKEDAKKKGEEGKGEKKEGKKKGEEGKEDEGEGYGQRKRGRRFPLCCLGDARWETESCPMHLPLGPTCIAHGCV